MNLKEKAASYKTHTCLRVLWNNWNSSGNNLDIINNSLVIKGILMG